MKFSELSIFKKFLAESPVQLCLITGKERDEAIEALVSAWRNLPKVIEAEDFSKALFYEEVETLPFLTQATFLHIQGVENLKTEAINALKAYLSKPNKWVYLLLSGEELHSKPLLKCIEQSGCLLHLADEKPWEKEKRITQWVMEGMAKEGVHLPQAAATVLVKEIGVEKELLRRELEKLSCYIGKKGQATLADVQAVCCKGRHDTIWQWGDAIFRFHRANALEIGRKLLEEGEALFVLLAQLRSMVRQGLDILSYFQAGGMQGVTQAFPYLKGGLLQKKLEEVKSYGEKRLRQALLLLFECEVRAKNSADEPLLLLELLIIKLTTSVSYDSASAA